MNCDEITQAKKNGNAKINKINNNIVPSELVPDTMIRLENIGDSTTLFFIVTKIVIHIIHHRSKNFAKKNKKQWW